MKVKYVFVFEDTPPLDMQSCYIFDNFEDAQNFFFEKGFILDNYNDDASFSISSVATKIAWHGDTHKGYYY